MAAGKQAMDAKNTALILVGYQNDYFSPRGKLHSVMEDSYQATIVLANTLRLVEQLSTTPTLIISTPVVFSKDYRELNEPVGILANIKEVGAFQSGNIGAETVPELKRFHERIIEVPGKRGLNAFSDTILDEVLQSNQIEHVIIAGVITSICVDSTGRAAVEQGYRVTILRDCTCGRSHFEQAFFCDKIFPIYGHVCTHTEFLDGLRTTSDNEPRVNEVALQVQQRLFEELTSTQRRYRELVEKLRNVVFKYDQEGRITFVNPAWENLLGYTSEETLGQPLSLFIQENQPALELGTVKMDGRSYEINLRSADGHTLWFELSVQVGEDGGGIGLLYEISAKKEEQRRLQEAKALAEDATRAKSSFLAVMSHEIRTPMNGVIGMADLLARTDLDKRQQRFVTTLRESGERMLALVDELLDFSKIESGKVSLEQQPMSVAEVIDRTVRLMEGRAQLKGLTLETKLDPQLPSWVLGDKNRLGQILNNLVGNALKFTDQGDVTISARVLADELLEFTVQDTGSGIPKQTQQQLFEPFVQLDNTITREHGGTGLGLAICRRLVTLMGGKIGVESSTNKGATFRFTLHAKITSSNKTTRPPQTNIIINNKGETRSLSVLLVEDDATSREVISDLLLELGHHPHSATNGVEALARLDNERFDLVLMDIHMPDMDGLEAARCIGAAPQRYGSAPLIALTADALPETRASCRAVGMAGYMNKPVDLARLGAGLERFVR